MESVPVVYPPNDASSGTTTTIPIVLPYDASTSAGSEAKLLTDASGVDIYKTDEPSQSIFQKSEENGGLESQDLGSQSQEPSKHNLSSSHRTVLLLLFCLAEFLDTFNISELYTALPTIAVQLNMNGGESIWLISAYQLSLASCLLVVRTRW